MRLKLLQTFAQWLHEVCRTYPAVGSLPQALGPQLARIDQSMQALLKAVMDNDSSPSLNNELAVVERAAADFIKEAKSMEVLLHNLDVPQHNSVAVQREIAELEQELREKNALIVTIEEKMAEWTGKLAQQNKEAQTVLDGPES